MFLDLSDPDPSLFCMDPDPSINKQKSKKNLDLYTFVTSFDFLSMKTDCNVPSKRKRIKRL
jgi:hypothetical protein